MISAKLTTDSIMLRMAHFITAQQSNGIPRTDLYCMLLHLNRYIYKKLYKSSCNRACLSRAKDPIAQLDTVHNLVKDVAEDVTEGITMMVAIVETPSLSLLG